MCSELSRTNVFDALKERRCYATTGTPIALSFTVDGEPMGSELAVSRRGHRPEIKITCRGTNGIDHVRIVKDGRYAVTDFAHGEREYSLGWIDSDPPARGGSYYYVRVVQKDRESAWSSPIWIEHKEHSHVV